MAGLCRSLIIAGFVCMSNVIVPGAVTVDDPEFVIVDVPGAVTVDVL